MVIYRSTVKKTHRGPCDVSEQNQALKPEEICTEWHDNGSHKHGASSLRLLNPLSDESFAIRVFRMLLALLFCLDSYPALTENGSKIDFSLMSGLCCNDSS